MLESVADVDLPTELRKSYHSFTIKVDQEHQLPFWNVAVGLTSAGRPNRAAPEGGSHSQSGHLAIKNQCPAMTTGQSWFGCRTVRTCVVRVEFGSAARGSWDGEEGRGQVD